MLRFRVALLIGVMLCLPAAVVSAEAAGDVAGLLVSRQLAEARGLAIGDEISIAVDAGGDGARSFRIDGIFEPMPDPFRLTDNRFEVRLHLPDLLEMTAVPGNPLSTESVRRINVALENPANAGAFAGELAARLPGVAVMPTAPAGENLFIVLERFHLAIAIVTVIGSTAFLLSLMVMRADERRETAGVLRLIGLARSRVLLEVFIEGLVVAVVGAVFGVLLAIASQGLFNGFFRWHYDTTLMFVRVTPGIAMRCVALAIPLGVLAGLLASWTLLRRNILSLLRR